MKILFIFRIILAISISFFVCLVVVVHVHVHDQYANSSSSSSFGFTKINNNIHHADNNDPPYAFDMKWFNNRNNNDNKHKSSSSSSSNRTTTTTTDMKHENSQQQQQQSQPPIETKTTSSSTTEQSAQLPPLPQPPVVVAHVVSLITCHKKKTKVTGYLDSLMILRHSIHQHSIHNNNNNNVYSDNTTIPLLYDDDDDDDFVANTTRRRSRTNKNTTKQQEQQRQEQKQRFNKNNNKYSYQMIAFVHEEGGCDVYIPLLRRLGYIPMIYPTPVNISDLLRWNKNESLYHNNNNNNNNRKKTVTDEQEKEDEHLQNVQYYMDHVEMENCCGSKEFIKLYAYTLTSYPIVVHWDIDVIVVQSLDNLYDAMLYPFTHPIGYHARQKIHLQRRQYDYNDYDRQNNNPNKGTNSKGRQLKYSHHVTESSYQQHKNDYHNNHNYIEKLDYSVSGTQTQQQQQLLSDNIEAFYTLDVTSSYPWESVQPVQGGFLMIKPNIKYFQQFVHLIHRANYTRGRGPGSGWDGKGYGGFQGAMAYQGVLAYFYDVLYPQYQQQQEQQQLIRMNDKASTNTTTTTSTITTMNLKGVVVRLDECRYNQVGADVIWRGPMKLEHLHQCRQYPMDGISFENNTIQNKQCEDCRNIPISQIYMIHYTACKKPWECTLPYPRIPTVKKIQHTYRLQELTNITTCGLLLKEYFLIRKDLEKQIAFVSNTSNNNNNNNNANNNNNNNTNNNRMVGQHLPEYFLGYCRKHRNSYIPMEEFLPPNFDMKEIYGF